MALMARSIEMSFSLSRLRRTLKSMSIWLPLVPRVVVVGGAPAAELDLHLAGSKFLVAELALLAGDVQDHRIRPGVDNPALDGAGVPRRPGGQRDAHQPAPGAAPVTGLGERPVHPGRADLQRVRGLAHDPGVVQFLGQRTAELGDVVQAGAAIGVHHDAEQAAPAGRRDLHRFQVHARGPDDRLEYPGDSCGVRGTLAATGCTGAGRDVAGFTPPYHP